MKKRGLYSRMSKLKQMRLHGVHFNPKYLVPDRIINSTDVFAAIHHKKGNQIAGTWQESLVLICSKILNFEKEEFPYGTMLIDEITSIKEEKSKSIFYIEVIMNRLYFGLYEEQATFWKNLGQALNHFTR